MNIGLWPKFVMELSPKKLDWKVVNSGLIKENSRRAHTHISVKEGSGYVLDSRHSVYTSFQFLFTLSSFIVDWSSDYYSRTGSV